MEEVCSSVSASCSAPNNWKHRGNVARAPSAGQETEVPDTHEAFRKNMQQEATQEFVMGQSGELLFVVVSGIAPAKSHLAIGNGDEAMVGDGHAMGVAAEILQHILGAAEGTFQVHHPVLFETVAGAKQRRSWVRRAASTFRGSGAHHSGRPAGGLRRTCHGRPYAVRLWAGSSCPASGPSGCDRARDLRREPHNGYGDGA